MSKKEFLEQLERHLYPLSSEDRKEIIEDYSMLITEKINEGFDEYEAIASLGSPKHIATQYIDELLGDQPLHNTHTSDTPSYTHTNNSPKPFNLIIFIILQFFNFLVGIWIAFAIAVTGFALSISGLAVTFSSIVIPFSFVYSPTGISLLARIFAMFIVAGVGIILFNVGLLLCIAIFFAVKYYALWNISLLK